MLELPQVTLICVATQNHESAEDAIFRSMDSIKWGKVQILSDKDIDIAETNYTYIEPFKTIDDWNYFIFYDLHKYVNTEFCLLIHPDGYVINPDSWKPEFLNWDFCGAPWPENECFRTTSGEMIRVGNSVSIRSKRLLELPSKLGLVWEPHDGNTNEDTAICVHYRQHFIDADMTFAPVEIAAHFSHEIPVPETEGIKPFAFHYWEPYPKFSIEDCYKAYINLSSRTDRNEHMIAELSRVGVSANRLEGVLPNQVPWTDDLTHVMMQRTPGAIGCYYSQLQVMKEALSRGQHCWVMEDDLVYCDDLQDRLKTIEEFLSTHEWDIMWLGGTYHTEPTWHKSENGKHTHPDLQMCTCELNKDWEPTDNPNIVRTYGCWCTYSYIVNKDRLAHIIDSLEQNVYRSMGIDWTMILLQPNLHTYVFNPGCVKQMDNQSNIGNGITYFSTFASLGGYWFKDKL